MKIFISWSGDKSRQFAESLREWLIAVLRDVDPFLSTKDIQPGTRWQQDLSSTLRDSQAGVLCITRENISSPWLLFEAGALSKVIENAETRVCPLLLGLSKTELSGPLSQFQAVDSTEDDVFFLVTSLNSALPQPIEDTRLKAYFDKWWPDLDKAINKLVADQHQNTLATLEAANTQLCSAIHQLGNSPEVNQNRYFRDIIFNAIDDFTVQLNSIYGVKPSFLLPYILYPKHLVSLLKTYKLTVKALALIDVEEDFWRDRTGQEIRRFTQKDSTRIFVFRTKKQMVETTPQLLKHSEGYHVGAISYDHLTREFPDYVYDFSLIGDIGTRLLARYETETLGGLIKYIRFSTEKSEVSHHEDAMNEIIQAAVVVSPTDDPDDLVERTFHPIAEKYTRLEKKQVEMSAYIPIHEYDEYEERHAYYVEMMTRMIAVFDEHRQRFSGTISALEFGAGTGIFTKRLVSAGNLNVKAVEIDWACFTRLQHNMKPHKNVECLNEDSRTYDPEGTFHYIFSSFADHHIKPYDKAKYFNNIKKNIKKGGLVIIGDEFLPAFDRSSVEERRDALKRYHGHIIELAREQGETEVAALEEAALESGLKEIGDFKMSCEEYEELLADSGFLFEKEKIGPNDREDVGGVYVYILHLKDGS